MKNELLKAGSSSTEEILKERISKLQFPSSTETLDLSDIAGGFDVSEISKQVLVLIGRNYIYLYRDDITDPEYTHAKLQVARCELDNNGKVVNVVFDTDASLVSETFNILSGISFFASIKRNFDIIDNDEQSKKVARRLADENNRIAAKQQEEIDEIRGLAVKNSLQPQRDTLDIEDDELVGSVAQGEMGFLGSNSPKKYLETLGAGPCIIVTAYNPESKEIAMSHIDALTDENIVLSQILNSVGKMQIRVFGGDESSINQLVSIKKILASNNASVAEWDVLNSTKSVIMERETGNVFNVANAKNRSSATEQNSDLMQLRAFQGKQPAKNIHF